MQLFELVSQKMLIEVNPGIFNKVYLPYVQDNTRHQIFFGGASSGKSVFLAQRSVLDALAGRNYLVLRNVARTVRGSCWNEVVKAINSMPEIAPMFSISKSEMLITCLNNGCQIMFGGLDNVEKIKSITPAHGALTDIWVEEATEVARDDVKQLEKRLRGESKHPKRLTLSFNPLYKEHWIYTQYFGDWDEGKRKLKAKGLSILKTTYLDNRFLTKDDRLALQNEKDPYYRNVYTLGNWGVLGDVVFRNWRVDDLSAFRVSADMLLHGLDFGFSSDPAAAIKVHYDKAHRRIYVLDELYERGLTNSQLAVALKDFCGNHYITCDSSEPKSIAELRGYGIRSMPAKKGPDSVVHGIQWLQGHEIIVHKECQHVKNELLLYQWKKDKDGVSMRVPEDNNNHTIDALRYACEGEMRGKLGFAQTLPSQRQTDRVFQRG